MSVRRLEVDVPTWVRAAIGLGFAAILFVFAFRFIDPGQGGEAGIQGRDQQPADEHERGTTHPAGGEAPKSGAVPAEFRGVWKAYYERRETPGYTVIGTTSACKVDEDLTHVLKPYSDVAFVDDWLIYREGDTPYRVERKGPNRLLGTAAKTSGRYELLREVKETHLLSEMRSTGLEQQCLIRPAS